MRNPAGNTLCHNLPVRPVPPRYRWRKALLHFLPERPIQLVPLFAAFCFAACLSHSWLVLPNFETAERWGFLDYNEIYRWVVVTQAFSFVLLLAGAGAYVCCIWRLDNPFRKWITVAVTPAIVGTLGGLFVPALVVVSQRRGSVLEKYNSNPFRSFRLPPGMLLLNMGEGFRLALLGLILALAAAWMLRTSAVTLPVRFSPPTGQAPSENEGDTARPRQKLFALYVLAFPWLAANLLSLLLSPLINRFSNGSPSREVSRSVGLWTSSANYLLLALLFFLIAASCLADQRKKQLREAVRLPSAEMLGIASFVGVAAFFLPHLVAYGIDRVAWAQHWSATPDPPVASQYLHVPPLGPHLVLVAIAAGLSEWCWRGCVQPQFVRIFGVARGLFLVGILYGSVQQIALPRFFPGLFGFFCNFVLMLVSGIAWSVVFGWLTIRATSVWPAVTCAALIGVLVWGSGDDTLEQIPRAFLRLSLLAFAIALVFVLIRYLPLEADSEGPTGPETPAITESAR